MGIHGNLLSGQTITLPEPKILVNGFEVPGGIKKQDGSNSFYLYSNLHPNAFYVAAPATITFTCANPNVVFYFTLNNRTPRSGYGGGSRANSIEKQKSGEWNPANPLVLTQNSSGDNTIIKVRAFEVGNHNNVSPIIKLELNVVGGNTVGARRLH